MALLALSNIEKSFGPLTVLKGLSLSLERGDRLCLIGRNGCGKTTLLNIITGREEPDRGEKHFARDIRLAWLDQKPDFGPDRTVLEEARRALADLEDLERRLVEWHHTIATAPNHELSGAERAAFARDEAAFAAAAGSDRERRLTIALETLGLSGELLSRPCGQLSGGELTRLALARFMASPFDVLILDEPTNHLDILGIEWLQTALLETAKTFVVVSHDRAFLDAVASKVAEIEDGKLTVVSGNYTQFSAVKAERLKALQREADLEARFLADEMEFIRRYMAGQRSREAKGRLKRLARRKKIEAPVTQRTLAVKFKGGKTHADVVLSVSDLSVKAGDRTLFANLSFELTRGEKLAIVGANGAGKTTLARVLLGELPAAGGRLRLAPQLKTGTFTQDLRHLRDDRTVLEEYARLVNPPNLNVARGPLGAFLFSGSRVEQRVENLSGGERARLALCILVAKENDVLVLDEPTNHLDIPSRLALEEALERYPGTCLIISHDRRFLDRVTTRTLWLDGPYTKVYGSSYSEARAQREIELAPARASEMAATARGGGNRGASPRPGSGEPRRVAPALPKPRKLNEYKLNAIETRIAELEEKRQLLNARLYDEDVFRDGRKVREVSAELDEIEKQLLQLNKEWEAVIDAGS
ncbi:MAG: ABC-F family ATP-binding cassette domain-containing protein [Planctomycetota bacterium]|nr:ABC-F family ATP-binding cassette domain-containing protein [Planctomycetota bacterium]